MEDIKVGEYVRTKKYGIKKIEHLAVNPNVTVNKYRYYLGLDKDGDRCYGVLKTTDIMKHSKNIIDLIEIGDFVEIIADGQPLRCEVDEFDYKNKLKDIGEEIIVKSIVTKEQFNSIKYKLEE